MVVWLYSRRNSLDTEDTQKELGFLYLVYGTKRGQYLWEVVELVRKLALTSLVLFFSAGSPFQITFALILSAYAHVAHALYQPFVDRGAYHLQHGSLTVTTLVYTLGLLFKVDTFDARGASPSPGSEEPQDWRVRSALGILLVIACAAFLAAALVLACVRARDNVKKAAAKSDLAGRALRRVTVIGQSLPFRGGGFASGRASDTNGGTVELQSVMEWCDNPVSRANRQPDGASASQPRSIRAQS